MKTIVINEFCVALLLTYVRNGIQAYRITAELLERMAEEGIIINDLLKPLVNGSLGSFCNGILYKGELLPRDNFVVAMKFSNSGVWAAKREYEMYTYLEAINNPNVTANGIPSICYYGEWEGFTLLAMTLLNSPFQKPVDVGKLNELDLLIVFREFVKAIKYIHSRGIVIHSDINIENMIKQNGLVFMFDLETSVCMAKCTEHKKNIELAKRDFQRFLSSKLNSVEFWYFVDKVVKNDQTNGRNKHSGLQRVLVEFQEYAFNDGYQTKAVVDDNGSVIPFYDHLYRIINEEMKNDGDDISSIPDPFDTIEWHRPPINFDFFVVEFSKYKDDLRDARRKEKEAADAKKKAESKSGFSWLTFWNKNK